MIDIQLRKSSVAHSGQWDRRAKQWEPNGKVTARKEARGRTLNHGGNTRKTAILQHSDWGAHSNLSALRYPRNHLPEAPGVAHRLLAATRYESRLASRKLVALRRHISNANSSGRDRRLRKIIAGFKVASNKGLNDVRMSPVKQGECERRGSRTGMCLDDQGHIDLESQKTGDGLALYEAPTGCQHLGHSHQGRWLDTESTSRRIIFAIRPLPTTTEALSVRPNSVPMEYEERGDYQRWAEGPKVFVHELTMHSPVLSQSSEGQTPIKLTFKSPSIGQYLFGAQTGNQVKSSGGGIVR
ncbi:hypothetical protein ARMSODRAFT_980774 [Armillaria solidipes]|uniref:Uncharacterized protein n=1 Tax=Armillaria solidipes TaxID=1076256 RepID=A0A2H3AUA9_9AGAR|nr:hypothetical protein ARMSODRAFT_980774 [Armillaria solidipes]